MFLGFNSCRCYWKITSIIISVSHGSLKTDLDLTVVVLCLINNNTGYQYVICFNNTSTECMNTFNMCSNRSAARVCNKCKVIIVVTGNTSYYTALSPQK